MKLSFPSLDQIGASLLRIYKRFPFVIFVTVIGTVSALWLADLSYSEQDDHSRVYALAFTCALGVSFLFGLTTFLEKKSWNSFIKNGVKSGGLALLVLYWVILGDQMLNGPSEIWYRFFLLFLGSHLFVAFAPFLSPGKLDQFWEYNKSLFLRILLSVLYSGVLFVGLSIALLAIDNLLGLNVDGETYMQLFLFLGGIFNTWFFLVGVPEKEEIQSKLIIFPTGLRVFVQYVLIPLVSVYIFILYLYLGKILIQWELPNGWVSNLVLSFSIAGILSLLLLYPIRNSKKFKWVSFYSKYYYLVLIPLIGLLMFSIWVRISEYGVTINRYFVATLGVWLTGIVIYFILSKTKSIKVIPVSLCLIALGVSFGPLGAFAVSERSQISRLNEVLQKNGMLSNEMKMQKTDSLVDMTTGREISSKLDYLVENHGLNSLQVYFVKEMKEVLVELKSDRIGRESAAEKITRFLGIRYIDEWEQANSDKAITDGFMYGLYNQNSAINIEGYDLSFKKMRFWSDDDSSSFVIDDENWLISYSFKEEMLLIQELNSGKELKTNFSNIVLEIRGKHPDKIRSPSTIPPEDLILEVENDEMKVLFLMDEIMGSIGKEVRLSMLEIDAYIKIK